MARPREFDRKEVLKKATFLFWEKGFEATSMEELVSVTGLNRGSMYNLFRNKEGLFLATIDNYFEFLEENFAPPLKEAKGLESIEEYFNLIGDKLTRYGRGCFFTNSAIENRSVPVLATEKVDVYYSTLYDLFTKCLEVAKSKQEIDQDSDMHKMATYLVCVTQGLSVMSKMNKRQGTLKLVIERVMEGLK